jgi:glyoxylase-like metal-dependent hydrolase (beta-lactamase superfamily II)
MTDRVRSSIGRSPPTTTHFHPEHSASASAFVGEATFMLNRAQADELAVKGPGYLEMFGAADAAAGRELAGAEVAKPDVVYARSYDLDLGGRVVELRATGRGHTKGDQIVRIPELNAVFTGDLVLNGHLPVLPWFAPGDYDASGINLLATLERLATERPQIVVPGHGAVSDATLVDDVRETVRVMRDESWARQDSAMSQETIVAEVSAVVAARHPDWAEREWVHMAIECLWAERPL